MEYMSKAIDFSPLWLFSMLICALVYRHFINLKRNKQYAAALFDSLTGLPNEQQLALTGQQPGKYTTSAFILIELNSFNDINVIFGHDMGQQMLQKTARLLQDICQQQGDLYKLNQGEYLVVCQNNQHNNVVHLIGKIIYFISNENYHLHDHATLLTITAGICLGVDDYEKALAYARLAKEEARRQRKDWVIYKKELHLEKAYQENLYILNRVQQALRCRLVLPYYQPILDIYSNQVIGCEALVRLRDSEGHIYAPGTFLNVVKRSNLYRQLTLAMIHSALKDMAHTGLTVSLNLDAVDMKDEGIINALIEGVQSHGMVGRVIIELIESEYVSDFERMKEIIAQLKRYGIRLAIDDFGVGYSNFEYVTRFDIDYIKVDGSIIQQFRHEKTAHAIVKAIASFALELNIPLVAEHVSCEEEIKELKRLNFRYLQGYYIGEPMPADELTALFTPVAGAAITD
jgi:diguanylate cyclase (GGDEF)-like protein